MRSTCSEASTTRTFVKIFEYFESAEYIDMIMESALGGTLKKLIDSLYRDDDGELRGMRPVDLTEVWVATLLAQLLGALTYAHDVVGVIQKDLKSDNVLLIGEPGLASSEAAAASARDAC